MFPDSTRLLKFGCFSVILLFLLGYIFFQSGTLEITQDKVIINGLPYNTNVYNFHWDRLGNYIISIPEKMNQKFQEITGS